jgi:hypothetical protein
MTAGRSAPGVRKLGAAHRSLARTLLGEDVPPPPPRPYPVVHVRTPEKNISNIFSKLGLPPSDSDHRRVLAVLAYLGS